jgi:hypothetical protein
VLAKCGFASAGRAMKQNAARRRDVELSVYVWGSEGHAGEFFELFSLGLEATDLACGEVGAADGLGRGWLEGKNELRAA